MTVPTVAPYGSWKSPLQAAQLVSASLGLSQVRLDGGFEHCLLHLLFHRAQGLD